MTEDTVRITKLEGTVAALRKTLGAFIAWSPQSMGEGGVRQLLEMLDEPPSRQVAKAEGAGLLSAESPWRPGVLAVNPITDELLAHLTDLRDRATAEAAIMQQAIDHIQCPVARASCPSGNLGRDAQATPPRCDLASLWEAYLTDCGDTMREALPREKFLAVAREGIAAGDDRQALRERVLRAEDAHFATAAR